MKKQLLAVAVLGMVAGTAQAAPKTWTQLCSDGTVAQNSAALPKVNYNDATIKKVARKFTEIENKELSSRQEDGKWETDQRTGTSYIKSVAFNPYSDIEKAYGLCSGKSKYMGKCKPEQKGPKGVGINTHNMLTILCGEYRDNITMLRKKLAWLGRAVITPNKTQTYSRSKKVFDQLTGAGYKGMVEISYYLNKFRTEDLGSAGDTDLELDQKSVAPMSVCEYRYVLSEYLSKGKSVKSRPEFTLYTSGLTKFMRNSKNCSASDKTHAYEFRGDGNFKAQSLESNGQLWFSRSFAAACTKDRKVGRKGYRGAITNSECAKYFKTPYKSREKVNEQAMLKMFFFPNQAQGLDIHEIMSNYDSQDPTGLVIATEDINGDGLGELVVLDPDVVDSCGFSATVTSPGACQLIDARTKLANFSEYGWDELNKADEVLYTIVVLAAEGKIAKNPAYAKAIRNAKKKAAKLFGTNKNYLQGIKLITEAHPKWKKSYMRSKDRGFTRIFTDKEEAWDRMAIVLDRHTDWYSIDTLHLKNGYFKPTFSPWIASSYYLYNSHAFTIPGYAMNLDLDPGRMHWMYVQKVKLSKWFNASHMNAQWPIPATKFDIMNFWFDEMTFSRSRLGSSENGWDRFGGVASSEMESILWLYDVPKFNFHH